MTNVRVWTCAVLAAVEQGLLDRDSLIQDLLGWLSEAEVEEFVRANDLVSAVKPDEDYDPIDDFNYVGSRHHY